MSILSTSRMSDVESDGRCINNARDPPGQRSIYIPPGNTEREIYRLSTFKDYPNNVPINVCTFANNGFYFTGYKDRVKCFSCGQTSEDWLPGDDPSLPGWHKPECEFINGNDTTNISIQSRTQQLRHHQPAPTTSYTPTTSNAPIAMSAGTMLLTTSVNSNQPSSNDEVTNSHRQTATVSHRMPVPPSVIAASRATENIPTIISPQHGVASAIFPCDRPMNPHMRNVTSRMQTFYQNSSTWPDHVTRATPQEIANAGMYYLGQRDRVKCWYCNGGLQHWKRDDKPWEEHAKWFPTCEFLLQQKGPEFVHEIVARYPNLTRPPMPNQPNEAYVPPIRRAVESGPRFLPLPGPYSGRNGAPVIVDPREEQRERQRRIEEEMTSSELVCQAKLMGFEERAIRYALKRQFETNDRNFSSFASLVDSILSHEGSVSNNDEEEEEAPSASEVDPFISISNMSATAGAQEIKRLEESRRCKICREESASVVLIPCGHLACCVNCGRIVESCPICHSVVREKVRSFIV